VQRSVRDPAVERRRGEIEVVHQVFEELSGVLLRTVLGGPPAHGPAKTGRLQLLGVREQLDPLEKVAKGEADGQMAVLSGFFLGTRGKLWKAVQKVSGLGGVKERLYE